MTRRLDKKNMTWTHVWVLSWHLTEGRLTEMDGRACLKLKQT